MASLAGICVVARATQGARPYEATMSEKIEHKTAETILQDNKVVHIKGVPYMVKPCTLATLVRMSQLVADLPADCMDKEDPVHSVFKSAKDAAVVAEIIAVGVVGEKKCRGMRAMMQKARVKRVARKIYNECTPADLKDIFSVIIGSMGVADFFAVTTFLQETNVTKQTKVG